MKTLRRWLLRLLKEDKKVDPILYLAKIIICDVAALPVEKGQAVPRDRCREVLVLTTGYPSDKDTPDAAYSLVEATYPNYQVVGYTLTPKGRAISLSDLPVLRSPR